MRSKTFRGKEWAILWKTTTNFHHQSKRICLSFIKIYGARSQMILSSSKSSAASNIQTEQNCPLICGFSKVFADSSILNTVFYWMLELNLLIWEFSDFWRHSQTRTWVEWQDLWASMPTSSQNKVK